MATPTAVSEKKLCFYVRASVVFVIHLHASWIHCISRIGYQCTNACMKFRRLWATAFR